MPNKKNSYGNLCEVASNHYYPIRNLIDMEIGNPNNPNFSSAKLSTESIEKINAINEKRDGISDFYTNENFINALKLFEKMDIFRRLINATLDKPLFSKASIFLACVMGMFMCREELYRYGPDKYLIKQKEDYNNLLDSAKKLFNNNRFCGLINEKSVDQIMSDIQKTLGNDQIGIRLKLVDFLNIKKKGDKAISRIAIIMFGVEICTYFDIRKKHLRKLTQATTAIATMIFEDEAPNPTTIYTHLEKAIEFALKF